MKIIYEKAKIEDAYDFEEVVANSWKETYASLLPDEYLEERVNNVALRVPKYEKNFFDTRIKSFVARDKEKIVGILKYGISDNSKYNDYGYIQALYVLKEYQGYGIGKELFKMAILGLKELGYTKIMLECMCGNETINFYKKYLGKVVETIDFSINRVGNVRADVLIFTDLDETLKKISFK